MVERRARAEPLELVGRHRVAHGDLELLAVPTRYPQPYRGVRLALKEVRKSERLDDISGADAAVVCLVDEPERQNALFLRCTLLSDVLHV